MEAAVNVQSLREEIKPLLNEYRRKHYEKFLQHSDGR